MAPTADPTQRGLELVRHEARWPKANPERLKGLLDVVRANVADPNLREDFLQEVQLHLWKCESEKPGQTPSWYLKSCWFCVQDQLGAGRSLDSFKRRYLQCPLPEDSEEMERYQSDDFLAREDVVQNVAALDALAELMCRLEPEDRVVLDLLDQGYTVCQIARRLCVSHPHIVRSRRRIAAMAARIGFGY